MVQMQELHEAADEHPLAGKVSAAVEAATGGTDDALALHWFLAIMYQAGPKLQWFARQLLVVSALAIDSFLPSLDIPSNPLDVGLKHIPGKRWDPKLSEAVLADKGTTTPQVLAAIAPQYGLAFSWHQEAAHRALVKYYLAASDINISIYGRNTRQGLTDDLNLFQWGTQR